MLLRLVVSLLVLAAHATAYKELSDAWLKNITSGDADFDIHDGKLLAPLLIPRVPGTPGQAKAQEHFASFFTSQLPEWSVTWQNSTGKTPATGDRDIPFQNLIIRRQPPWAKEGRTSWLTLVAHYDSKLKPKGFIGAIDSAAPCAMLMHTARSIEPYLSERFGLMRAGRGQDELAAFDVGVQILFLDGEEAFVSWTSTDSLYGSRSLAQTWENKTNPAMSSYRNPLDQIGLFVLLDLLGSADPSIPSYFRTTHWAYRSMAKVEKRMRDLKVLESDPSAPFLPDGNLKSQEIKQRKVSDDHLPFMARGVPILHVIPSRFPPVWHKIEDDGEHLDMPTVRDWSRIVTAFALEWLDLMDVEGAVPSRLG